jgi:cytochrome c biogenesis protein CcdA/thiol-disulfide isomerase/thioredoxin
MLLLFSFLAGFVTILAPCIWPMLPIVLSSSVAGNKGEYKRPIGITLGIMISFAFFTLSISYLVSMFHLDPNIIRLFAVIVIAFLGVMMIIPSLETWLELHISRITHIFVKNPRQSDNGFISSFITGLSLGIVWTPCAGPILATIAVLTATRQVTFYIFLITLFYIAGVGVPLFVVAYSGQKFISRIRKIHLNTRRIQQVFGGIMILSSIAIFTNIDQIIQLQLLQTFPAFGTVVNGFENSSFVTQQLNLLKGIQESQNSNSSGLFNINSKAPDFTGIDTWLNSDKPLNLEKLKGKVVLVDFWTYTCINCIRTLPHIVSWYEKYKDDGFIVIGVHTPEFLFEHDTHNVTQAIKMYGIKYPVAQDNEYKTWNAYRNEYWPAEYLIDAKGNLRRSHFGEGEYDQTEQAIQALLKESGKNINNTFDVIPDQTPTSDISPETYFGSNRMQYYYPTSSLGNGEQNFVLSEKTVENSFSFGGQWNITPETAIAGDNAILNYHFIANNVYVILRPPPNTTNGGQVKVLIDGNNIDNTSAGLDVHDGMMTVDTDRLYSIVNLHGKTENHMLKLEFLTPGIQVYTFTFG